MLLACSAEHRTVTCVQVICTECPTGCTFCYPNKDRNGFQGCFRCGRAGRNTCCHAVSMTPATRSNAYVTPANEG
jgi:hypothetical protein